MTSYHNFLTQSPPRTGCTAIVAQTTYPIDTLGYQLASAQYNLSQVLKLARAQLQQYQGHDEASLKEQFQMLSDQQAPNYQRSANDLLKHIQTECNDVQQQCEKQFKQSMGQLLDAWQNNASDQQKAALQTLAQARCMNEIKPWMQQHLPKMDRSQITTLLQSTPTNPGHDFFVVCHGLAQVYLKRPVVMDATLQSTLNKSQQAMHDLEQKVAAQSKQLEQSTDKAIPPLQALRKLVEDIIAKTKPVEHTEHTAPTFREEDLLNVISGEQSKRTGEALPLSADALRSNGSQSTGS